MTTAKKSAAAAAAALCCALSASASAGGAAPAAFVAPGTTTVPLGRAADRCRAAPASVPPTDGPIGALVPTRRRQRRITLGMTSEGGLGGDGGGGGGGGGGTSGDSSPDDSAESSSDKKDLPSGGKNSNPLRAEKDSSTSPSSEGEERYERSYRIAQKRAEIESLLSGPDPPFDAESELAKIPGGVQPPVTMEADSPEAELELKTSELEDELYSAVDRGDWDVAQVKRDELSREYVDDCGSVLQANLRFYRAFSSRDYDDMSELWLHDASVLCVHPSHAPLVGASAVLGSWRRMFDSSKEGGGAFRKNVVEPTHVRLSVRGATAIVSCDEEVYTRRFVRGERRKTELVNKLTATNVFRKVGGRWRMVHHHAAWHAESDAARRALGSAARSGGGGGGGSKTRSSRNLSNGNFSSGRKSDEHQGPGSVESSRGIPDHEGITGKGYGEKSDKKSGGGGNSDDPFSALDGLSSLGGLGGLGGGGGNLNPDGSNGPVRRVFMGSLSDLLNGGLSDLLSSGGSSSDKIIDASGNKGDDDDDDDEGPTIIRFISDDDEDDDEEDEDDEESEVSIQFVKEGPDGKGATVIRSVKKGDDGDDDDDDHDNKKASSKDGAIDAATEVSATAGAGSLVGGAAPKDALRQNCISALRRLAAQGAISAKQKRSLLTDIIVCSARGEFSMVEVAYELLCGECEGVVGSGVVGSGGMSAVDDSGCVPEERALAEEEFADQCRVFASGLPETPPYSPPPAR